MGYRKTRKQKNEKNRFKQINDEFWRPLEN